MSVDSIAMSPIQQKKVLYFYKLVSEKSPFSLIRAVLSPRNMQIMSAHYQKLALLFVMGSLWILSAEYTLAPVTAQMGQAASKIINSLLPSTGVTQESSVAWQRLAYITDTFGPRFSGSDNLENALSWIRDTAKNIDHLQVSEMNTYIPAWVRGEESAYLLQPRKKKIHMVGLGMCTPGNATAEVFVVSGHEDLLANCSRAHGKIVLFNTIFTTYGVTVNTRINAGNWAYACGAVAALIRSVGPFSMQSPHTGYTNPSPIPSAAISLEDAAQIQRMYNRGQNPIVSLSLESVRMPDRLSRNIIIDLVGSERPEEYVLLSGHGDSWDNAEGAMDDGGGFVSAWEAVRTLSALGLQPKRTVRAVVWVNEENGGAGGNQYLKNLGPTGVLLNHSFVLETDSGAFQPWGLAVSCTTDAVEDGGKGSGINGGCNATRAQLQLIGTELLASIGSGSITTGGEGADIEPTCSTGVPCIGVKEIDPRLLIGENNPCTADARGDWSVPISSTMSTTYLPADTGYFFYHHTEADTMERIDPRQLNHMAAALAIWAYSVAELPTLLPRDDAVASANANLGPTKSGSGSISTGLLAGIILTCVFLLGLIVFFTCCSSVCRRSNVHKRDALATVDIDEEDEESIEFK